MVPRSSAPPLRPHRVPVVGLTGHLGAGKTTLLNHLLRRPGARVGVVVNDFGEINVDAGLVTGQVDEAASIAGGCLCCLAADGPGGLDEALTRLSDPRLALDVVVVEASGLAEPLALAALLQGSAAPHVRAGGVVDVVDALEHFATVDTGAEPPARYAATGLVVVNKVDLVAPSERAGVLDRIEQRVRARNPHAQLVTAVRGRIDPALVFDTARSEEEPPEVDGQLAIDLRALALASAAPEQQHTHAASASRVVTHPVDAGRVADLLEDPPDGAYRLKGTVVVARAPGAAAYVVHVVGRTVHVEAVPVPVSGASELVVIGQHLDPAAAGDRLDAALAPGPDPERPAHAGVERLERLRRLSR